MTDMKKHILINMLKKIKDYEPMVSDSFDKWVLSNLSEDLNVVINGDKDSTADGTKVLDCAGAIQKWTFFGWNYVVVHHEWKSPSGTVECDELPEFLLKVKWTCNFDHMLKKWRAVTSRGNSDSYLPLFYRELDGENRRILVDWVMANYKA